MKEHYDFMPEYKPPKNNLFLEISELIIGNLKRYNIEHTQSEICFLRKQTLENLKEEGITQENYDNDSWVNVKGTIIYQIDKFYNTNIAKDIRSKFIRKN